MLRFRGAREFVEVGYLEAEIVQVLNLAAAWCARRSKKNKTVVDISSWNDHKHKKGSLHYEDKAVDLVVRDAQDKLDTAGLKGLARALKQHLPLGYDVVYDSPGHYRHIHVEWDVRIARA